jgi:hypothetical protein
MDSEKYFYVANDHGIFNSSSVKEGGVMTSKSQKPKAKSQKPKTTIWCAQGQSHAG